MSCTVEYKYNIRDRCHELYLASYVDSMIHTTLLVREPVENEKYIKEVLKAFKKCANDNLWRFE